MPASFATGLEHPIIAQIRSFYLVWPQEAILQTPSTKSSEPNIVQSPDQVMR